MSIAGTAIFGEHGWWSLTSLVPPNLKLALGGSILGKRVASITAGGSGQDWAPPNIKKAKPSGDHVRSRAIKASKQQAPSPVPPSPAGTLMSPPALPHVDAESASMLMLSEIQEGVVERYLSQCQLAVRADPKASRLLRKLKVRAKQRLYNQKVFDLDNTICRLLSSTVKYIVDKNAPYSDQVHPVLKPGAEVEYQQVNPQAEVMSRLTTPTTPQMDILDQLSLIPVLSRALPPEFKTFRQRLCGAGDVLSHMTSPYTSRKLPPFIFRTSDLTPPKVMVNREIVAKYGHQHPSQPPSQPKGIDFCYLQPHHVPAVNNLVSHFFWPVDISECLQYPDFTCVVLYGKLVVGCGFMTPDVKVNEAYISFLLVHPDFQNCSIGKIMLYHLIQSCMGKDVTLHVSVDNPAMLLYQTMGFKAERYCIDFYRHYYPEGHYLSKNAYFMRLRK